MVDYILGKVGKLDVSQEQEELVVKAA